MVYITIIYYKGVGGFFQKMNCAERNVTEMANEISRNPSENKIYGTKCHENG